METTDSTDKFRKEIGRKERRKLKARAQRKQSIWQGFSVFGLIGWSVAVPTVLFVLLGMWLDERLDSRQSYTLALLIAGLCLGCLNAWYWVDKKMKELQEDNEPNE